MRLAVATAVWLAALVLAGGATAAGIGANDDTGKFAADGGTLFFSQMADLGLKQSVMTVRFLPSDPTSIPDGDALDSAIPVAQLAGLRVTLAVYPYPPRQIEDGTARPRPFAAWLTLLANRYPTVKQYVVMNEPNQPAFLRPQFDARGRNISGARAGRFLAAAYDALKAVDPGIKVIGLGLSPRGNDRPTAVSNVSTSPVRFLDALGAWYRQSGRTKPIMDGLSFHPYPYKASDSPEKRYRWPNAGFANLDRIKQALWDAFRGTAQPTTAEWPQAVPGRGGLAGRHVRPCRLHRRRERSGDRSEDAGPCVLASRPHGNVRRDDRRGEHLRVLRRCAPGQGLPGGAERGRRHTPALRGGGASGDRAVGSRL